MSCILIDVKGLASEIPSSGREDGPSLEGAVLSLLRTADSIRSALCHILQPHGITPQQFDVLLVLSQAGEQGLPTLSIAERMVERTPGITRLLDRMEKRQWIWRHRCHHDRRIVYVGIAPTGNALLVRLDVPLRQRFRCIAETLTAAQHEQLEQSLTAICQQMQSQLT